jgi:NTE family protein
VIDLSEGLVQISRKNFGPSISRRPPPTLIADLRAGPLAKLRSGRGRTRRGSGCAFGRAKARAVLVALLLCGCVPTTTDTVPLQQAVLAPPQSDNISSDGYRLEALPTKYPPDLLVFVAMSGGGKRSAAYSYGALKAMREVTVPGAYGSPSLLTSVDAISGVSGGSFTAAYYGLYRDAAFGRYETDFLYADTDGEIKSVYLLPWNWGWAVDADVGTNDYMDRYYDQTMFHGARFKDLKLRGRPLIGVTTTDLNYGTPFLFSQEFFDIICSDLESFPVARAVAASNGFPGLFSSVTLTNHAADCGGRQPGWLRRVPEADLHNPLSRLGVQARLIERYLTPVKLATSISSMAAFPTILVCELPAG